MGLIGKNLWGYLMEYNNIPPIVMVQIIKKPLEEMCDAEIIETFPGTIKTDLPFYRNVMEGSTESDEEE
jgi:hypothetical protein